LGLSLGALGCSLAAQADLPKMRELARTRAYGGKFEQLFVSPDSRRLLTTGEEGDLILWDLPKRVPSATRRAPRQVCNRGGTTPHRTLGGLHSIDRKGLHRRGLLRRLRNGSDPGTLAEVRAHSALPRRGNGSASRVPRWPWVVHGDLREPFAARIRRATGDRCAHRTYTVGSCATPHPPEPEDGDDSGGATTHVRLQRPHGRQAGPMHDRARRHADRSGLARPTSRAWRQGCRLCDASRASRAGARPRVFARRLLPRDLRAWRRAHRRSRGS
jgi:hypothetical protein